MPFFSRLTRPTSRKTETPAWEQEQAERFCRPCQDVLLHFYQGRDEKRLDGPSQAYSHVQSIFGLTCAPFLSRPWETTSCNLCQIFASENHHSLPKVRDYCSEPENVAIWRQSGLNSIGGRIDELQVEIWSPSSTAPHPRLSAIWCAQIITIRDCTWAWEKNSSPCGHSTASPSTLTFIKDELTKCEDTHSQCRELSARSHSGSWRPLRLLDLRDYARGRIHLDECKSSSTAVRYASLSYRWGGNENFKLFKKDLPHWRKYGWSLQEFPTTIQQVMYVCQQLGVDHLWVDAICLLQEDPSWAEESVEMEKVYGAARLNIIADASATPYDKLFFNRDGNSVALRGTFWKAKHADKANKGTEQEWWVGSPDPWRTLIQNSYTARRAWVFQEELLACRTVRFGHDQVFWNCNGRTRCEMQANYKPHPIASLDLVKREFDGFRLGIPGTTRQYHEMQSRQQSRAFELLWSFIVESYTRRGISKDRDRLTALSGVASELKLAQPGNDYLAGLWSDRFEWHLCWTGVFALRRNTAKDVPTWSWGSVIGGVHMDIVTGNYQEDQSLCPSEDEQQRHPDRLGGPLYDSYQSMVTIHQIQVTPEVPRNPTGSVKGGRLRLMGTLLDIDCTISGGNRPHMLIGANANVRAYGGCPPRSYHCHLDGDPSIEGRVYYLPILYTKTPDPRIRGILLQTTGQPGTFRRIGYLKVRCRSSELSQFLLPSRKQRQLSQELYVKRGPQQDQYLIDII